MALLILGLGGFGVTNLSGTIRSVGSVGDKDISVDSYAQALDWTAGVYRAAARLMEPSRAVAANTRKALRVTAMTQYSGFLKFRKVFPI